MTWGSRTQLSGADVALNNLANSGYALLGSIDLSSAKDAYIELTATPGTVSGNLKQLIAFIQVSQDNVNWTTGPTSGTTATSEGVLYPIGYVPLPANATQQRRGFSVKAALGFTPKHVRLIAKNESGAALAAAGNDCHYQLDT